jgi:type I restriction enzyme S subunit
MVDSELPEGWAKCKLDDVLNRTNEKWSPEDGGEHRYLSLKHIEKDTGRVIGYGSSSEVDSSKTVFSEGDVLYGKLRPYLNKVARPSFEGICSTDILVFSSSPLIDNNFLKHRLRATDVVKYADQNSSGINLPRISPDDLGEFEIGLPPLPEQRRIADRLDAIQSRTQATGETLDQVPGRIEEYRQSVLNAAFTGRLTADWREDHPDVEPAEKLLEQILDERHKQWRKDYRAKYEAKDRDPPSGWKSRYSSPEGPDRDDLFELPETWTWVRLQQLSNVYSGVTKNSSKSGDVIEMPYLRVANVYADELRLDEIKQIKLKRTKKWKYLLEEGDLLVVEGNGSKKHIGRVAEWDGSIEPCVHQNHLIKVRPARRRTGKYVLNWMLSARGRQFITSEAKTTSGLYTLSLTKVRNIPVPLPPEEEQKEIVRRIRQRLDKIVEMAQHVSQAREWLDHLNRSVLAKAFRGELVETEAERAHREGRDYETAEELLARIRGDSSSASETPPSEPDATEPADEETTQVNENGQFEMKVIRDTEVDL